MMGFRDVSALTFLKELSANKKEYEPDKKKTIQPATRRTAALLSCFSSLRYHQRWVEVIERIGYSHDSSGGTKLKFIFLVGT